MSHRRTSEKLCARQDSGGRDPGQPQVGQRSRPSGISGRRLHPDQRQSRRWLGHRRVIEGHRQHVEHGSAASGVEDGMGKAGRVCRPRPSPHTALASIAGGYQGLGPLRRPRPLRLQGQIAAGSNRRLVLASLRGLWAARLIVSARKPARCAKNRVQAFPEKAAPMKDLPK